MKKINGPGVLWLLVMGLTLAMIPLTAACGIGEAEGNPQPKPASSPGTPQNPCLGNDRDCLHATWYITDVKVGEQQITCITQDTSARGYVMSCGKWR